MAYLSERKRIFLLMMRWWSDQKLYNGVKQIFNETFRDENTVILRSMWSERSDASMKRVAWKIAKFQDDQYWRLIKIYEEKQLDVAQSFVENLHFNMCKANQQHDINRMVVQRILKKIKFYPYKSNLVQELNEDDFNRRMEFCKLVMKKTDDDPNFFQYSLFNIFLDRAIFELNCSVNRHNCRFWSDNNFHWKLICNTLKSWTSRRVCWLAIFHWWKFERCKVWRYAEE